MNKDYNLKIVVLRNCKNPKNSDFSHLSGTYNVQAKIIPFTDFYLSSFTFSFCFLNKVYFLDAVPLQELSHYIVHSKSSRFPIVIKADGSIFA